MYMYFYIFLTCVSVISAKISPRIVEGKDTNITKIPYIVSLTNIPRLAPNQSATACGGTIISENHILTAAHCVLRHESEEISNNTFIKYMELNDLYISAGSNILGVYSEDGIKRTTTNIYVCPEYDEFLKGDLAILKLNESLPIGDSIQIIAYADQDEILPYNKTATVAGWGATKKLVSKQFTWLCNSRCYAGNNELINYLRSQYCQEFEGANTQLKSAEIPILSPDQCKELTEIENMFCAGFENGGAGICQGDSGGPLVVDGKLYGVVSSTTNGEEHCHRPQYYTEVGKYSNWIHNITQL